MTPGKLILLVGAVIGVLLLLIPLANSLSSGLVDTKGTFANPRGTHTAEFIRNVRPRTSKPYLFYRILLNEKTIHKTDSFNRKTIDYREQIVWNPKGTRFFFSVAGKRLYGYDVVEKRDLTPDEIEEIPLSTFEQTGYYGGGAQGETAVPFDQIVTPPLVTETNAVPQSQPVQP